MTLTGHFRTQATACRELGSPFTGLLLEMLAERLRPGRPVTDRLFHWPADRLAADALALRLAGALHALVLQGAIPGLMATYPPNDTDEERLWQAVSGAFDTHAEHILHWLESAPQTNEVRRSTALIIGACVAAAQFPGMPLRVSELGASAGLNLNFDRYALKVPGSYYMPSDPVLTLTPDVSGTLPSPAPFSIAERGGVDLNPLDPRDPEAILRLRSYIWADQADRMERTEAALTAAGPMPDKGDAAAWLKTRLSAPVPGRMDFLFHTIAWQYFPQEVQASCRTTIHDAAACATTEAPLAWLSFEADGQSPGAPVILRLWPGDLTLHLGRMDFHGRWFQAG